MNPLNIEDKINFKFLELKKGETYEIQGQNEIITIVCGKINDREKGGLSAFESSVYHAGNFSALEDSLLTVFDIRDLDIILNKVNVEETFGSYCRSNWKQLRELYDVEGFEKIDLYRGNQLKKEYNGVNYKFNLWFCGTNTNCRWHNQHDFIEVHTNIAGIGNMQKSIDGTQQGLFETVSLGIGATHRKFNISGEYEENGNPKYPFHRWLGGKTGNIWLVIEKY